MKEQFVLVDGYISMDNSKLYLDIKNNIKSDVKKRGGWLTIFLGIVGFSTFRNLQNDAYFEKVAHYINFGIRILGILTAVAILWYLLFKGKSKRNLIINEIKTIEIDQYEFESELTIQFLNKREIDLSFRNLEHQMDPFIEALKKRNSRIIIKTNERI